MLLIGLVLTALAAALSLPFSPLAGMIVDQVITQGQRELLLPILGLMVLTVSLKLGLRFVFQLLFEHIAQRALGRARNDLYHQVHTMDSSFFDKNKTGDLMAQLTGDLDAIRHGIAWVIYQVFENFLIFVFSVTLLFTINWQFTLVLLAPCPLIAWATFKLTKQVKPSFAAIREQFSRLNSMVQEYIAGNRTVKAFAREGHETNRFEQENQAYGQKNLESAAIWGTWIPVIEFFASLLVVIMLVLGGFLVINGDLSLGQLVVFSGMVWTLNIPLRMSGWLVNDIQRFVASLERVHQLSLSTSQLNNPPSSEAASSLAVLRSASIAIEELSFSFGDKELLTNINLHIEAGQTIGIVGPTGSGKTTLMRLLCRHFDCKSGTIRLNGTDIRKLSLQDLRRQVGMAMQDVFLFSDSIEGNIAFARPDASMEQVIEAAKLAQAHEFVTELSNSYDTVVGERGVGLSGGQRQRLSLARLFLARPAVMILDDTTSAVDIETEERLQDSFRQLHGTQTLFIISSRLSSVMHADQIVVLDQGKIIQQGSHQELLQEDGYYRLVWDHQNGIEDSNHGA